MKIRRQSVETSFAFEAGDQKVIHPNAIRKVGVYAGSFDPVHAGHLVFALKAQKIAGLDHVAFLPLREPHRNHEPEHYVHRSIMLNQALKPHKQFKAVDLPDRRLNVQSLARLKTHYGQAADFSLLTSASELLWHKGDLPKMYQRLPLIIAVTSHKQMAEVLERLNKNGSLYPNIMFVDIGTNHISSASIRSGLRQGKQVRGLLPSVWKYARQQWLYIPPVRH